jgi:hypothetical protein
MEGNCNHKCNQVLDLPGLRTLLVAAYVQVHPPLQVAPPSDSDRQLRIKSTLSTSVDVSAWTWNRRGNPRRIGRPHRTVTLHASVTGELCRILSWEGRPTAPGLTPWPSNSCCEHPAKWAGEPRRRRLETGASRTANPSLNQPLLVAGRRLWACAPIVLPGPVTPHRMHSRAVAGVRHHCVRRRLEAFTMRRSGIGGRDEPLRGPGGAG